MESKDYTEEDISILLNTIDIGHNNVSYINNMQRLTPENLIYWITNSIKWGDEYKDKLNTLLTVPFEDIPLHINTKEHNFLARELIEWRFKIGK